MKKWIPASTFGIAGVFSLFVVLSGILQDIRAVREGLMTSRAIEIGDYVLLFLMSIIMFACVYFSLKKPNINQDHNIES
jgi:hypothetical protein